MFARSWCSRLRSSWATLLLGARALTSASLHLVVLFHVVLRFFDLLVFFSALAMVFYFAHSSQTRFSDNICILKSLFFILLEASVHARIRRFEAADFALILCLRLEDVCDVQLKLSRSVSVSRFLLSIDNWKIWWRPFLRLRQYCWHYRDERRLDCWVEFRQWKHRRLICVFISKLLFSLWCCLVCCIQPLWVRPVLRYLQSVRNAFISLLAAKSSRLVACSHRSLRLPGCPHWCGPLSAKCVLPKALSVRA